MKVAVRADMPAAASAAGRPALIASRSRAGRGRGAAASRQGRPAALLRFAASRASPLGSRRSWSEGRSGSVEAGAMRGKHDITVDRMEFRAAVGWTGRGKATALETTVLAFGRDGFRVEAPRRPDTDRRESCGLSGGPLRADGRPPTWLAACPDPRTSALERNPMQDRRPTRLRRRPAPFRRRRSRPNLPSRPSLPAHAEQQVGQGAPLAGRRARPGRGAAMHAAAAIGHRRRRAGQAVALALRAAAALRTAPAPEVELVHDRLPVPRSASYRVRRRAAARAKVAVTASGRRACA